MVPNWSEIINDDAQTYAALWLKTGTSVYIVADKMGVDSKSILKPKLYYCPVADRIINEEVGFIPCIAEHKEGNILFVKEILKDTVLSLDHDSDDLIQAIMLHEVLHHILQHKSDTQEQRDMAEKEVNDWMEKNTPELHTIFGLGLIGTVKQIEKKYTKYS